MPDNDVPPDPRARSVKRITDPRALRALAHPIRLSLLGALRTQGPLTATKAAELIGESSASCSFHLRQLSKYGLVEEASGGHGRERPWQATTMFTDVPEIADNPELAAAADLFRSVILERYFENATRWLDAKAHEPREWQQAAQFNDRFLYLTADELLEVTEQIGTMLDAYADRNVSPELRPAESRLVSCVNLGFPLLGNQEVSR
ncbi:MAG TPA: helix-turn-helix domain-containing protein [Streptosporangiaceae bacterium]|nr:helix-turn-helix domain-containing protein [Streptosporangiaceae bacterium]